MFQVNWTEDAEITFASNIKYLQNDWNDVVIDNFLYRVDEVIEKISANPKQYILYKKRKAIYRCVVTEQIVLYYKILDNLTIDLLVFWNVYQNPKRLKLL
jgi:hypothetical protein